MPLGIIWQHSKPVYLRHLLMGHRLPMSSLRGPFPGCDAWSLISSLLCFNSFQDIFKQATEDRLTSAKELPYFEGDFWPNVLEESIKELEQEEEERKKEESTAASETTEVSSLHTGRTEGLGCPQVWREERWQQAGLVVSRAASAALSLHPCIRNLLAPSDGAGKKLPAVEQGQSWARGS